MKNYIWLNPVVSGSYNIKILEKILNNFGFKIVTPLKNHLEIVKGEYKDLLSKEKKLF